MQILATTLTNLHADGLSTDNAFYQPVYCHLMNPKAITMEELYGGIDKLTLEWHDGLMGLTVRKTVQVHSLCLLPRVTVYIGHRVANSMRSKQFLSCGLKLSFRDTFFRTI